MGEVTDTLQSKQSVSLLNPDESLDLVIKVTRACGLAPLTYTKSGNIATAGYSRSYGFFSVLLALLVGTTTIIGALHDLFEVEKYTIRMIGTTTIYVTLIDFAVLVVAFLVDGYYAVSRSNCFLSILAYFNKIDFLLPKSTRARKTHYAWLMFITITFSSVLFVVDCLVWYFNTLKHARKYGVLKFAPLYVLQELIIVLALQYWIMVDSIRRRTTMLRLELKSTGKQLEKRLSYVAEYKVYAEGKPKADCTAFVHEFTRILTAYQCIVKTVHFANTLYGMPILVFLFNVLLHEVVILYYWLEEVLYYQRANNLVWSLLWIICYGYILVLTVNGPHAIATECQHISANLAELLTLDLEESLRTQLNTFSAALIHQPIKFSARGLLDVDRKIITSMTAVITTYIVVLMQFSVAKNFNFDDDDDSNFLLHYCFAMQKVNSDPTPEAKSFENAVYLMKADESLKPMLLVSRAVGAAPFVWKTTGKITEYSYSVKYAVYSVVFLTILVGLSIFGCSNDIAEDDDKTVRMTDTLTIYVTSMDIGGVVFSLLFNTYNMIVKRKYFLSSLVCFNKVDLIFDRRFDGSEWRYYILRMCVAILAIAVMCTTDGCIWYSMTPNVAKPFAMLNYAPFYVSYVFATIFVLQYWLIVDCIKRRIVLIREELDNAKLQIGATNEFGGQEGFYSSERLPKLIRSYQCLFKAVYFVNVTYGIPLVVIFCNVLVHEVSVPYYLLIELFYKHRVPWIIQSLGWIIGYAIILLFTVQGPDDIEQECTLIASRVSEMLNMNPKSDLKLQLNIFCSSLTHQPIKFSASGLFDINRKSVTSVTQAITTYLIIIMQFNAMNQPEPKD